jgi:hypothetical protein
MNPLFFLTLFSLCLFSCDRKDADPNVLPEATQTGANTAGCIINGKVLIPKNGSQAIGGPPLYGLNLNAGNNFYPDKDDYWQLEIANKKDPNSMGVILWIKTMKYGNGDYIVGQSNGEWYDYGPNNNQIIAGIKENGVNKTYYSSDNSGIIVITKSDYYGGIYSGTFSATLYNKDNPSETIKITDGRFDINYGTLNH